MKVRRGRLAVVLLLIGGCGPGAARPAAAPRTAPTTASITTLPPSTPPPTDPPVGLGKVGPILLTTRDLPPGFVAAPASDTGAESTRLSPCGHAITASGPGVVSTRAVFDNAASRQRLVQQVLAFNGGNAAALVAQIGQVRDGCRRSGSLTVTPIHPLAVGEQVAGFQLSGGGRVIDVAVVRSGPIVVLVVLTAAGGSISPGRLDAVMAAAGTKLAVGTGG